MEAAQIRYIVNGLIFSFFFFTILVLLRDFKSMPVKVTVGYEGACKRDIPRQHLSDGGVY